MSADTSLRLGLRANAGQFWLLVLVNAFVGAMVGLERSILPALAEQEFGLAARAAILSFIVAFGLAKAATNVAAGRLSDRYGRRHVLIGGWLVAAPVPFLLMWAPGWDWIIAANVLLGVSQGLTWSTTVIMKIDLVGPRQRGLAMGLNEFAGYFAVAASALATGWIAAHHGLRPEPFYLGVAYVVAGLGLSLLAVRETRQFAEHEHRLAGVAEPGAAQAPGRAAGGDAMPTQREVLRRVSWSDRNLSSVSQAGLVNNLNDGMAWGLFPLVFAAAGASLLQVGWLAALYPAVWGLAQIGTGAWSDRIGRKPLIVGGMALQALGIAVTALAGAQRVADAGAQVLGAFAGGAVLLGLGTAMVYPALLAAIGDVAAPTWRASAVGIYRGWRDLGYVVGALLAGFTADAFGLLAAVWLVAALTLGSGIVAALRMTETRPAA
jgi:MFS family permease